MEQVSSLCLQYRVNKAFLPKVADTLGPRRLASNKATITEFRRLPAAYHRQGRAVLSLITHEFAWKIRSTAFNSGFANPGVYLHRLCFGLTSQKYLLQFLHLIEAKLHHSASLLSQFMTRLESQSLKASTGEV